jgi:UDP-N-acetylmuramate--alanine ligase
MDNLKEFVECFDGVDDLVILPIWSSGEIEIDIDLKGAFKRYNPIMADRVKKEDCVVKVFNGQHTIKEFSNDIIVAFGAGDITYQIRGE